MKTENLGSAAKLAPSWEPTKGDPIARSFLYDLAAIHQSPACLDH